MFGLIDGITYLVLFYVSVAPLVLSTATSGVAGNIPVWAGLGSASFAANTGAPVLSTGLPYASVFAPFLYNPGSGYTNAGPVTTYLEVEPWLDLSIYWDGKGTVFIGINGRTVMTVGTQGVTPVLNGATTNVFTTVGESFYASTSLTSSVMPVTQLGGSALGMLPQSPLAAFMSVTNTTANARSFYASEFDLAVEYF